MGGLFMLEIDVDSGLIPSSVPSTSPSSTPSLDPTSKPSTKPSISPTEEPPVNDDCEEDEDFRYKDHKKKDCDWVGKDGTKSGKARKRIRKKCKRKHNQIYVFDWCLATCGKVKLGDCKVD